MIIVKLRGGLGNQLFQYALGRHLALLNQTDLKLDVSLFNKPRNWVRTHRQFGLSVFNIEAMEATNEEIHQLAGYWPRLRILFGLNSKCYFTEPHFHFYPQTLSLKAACYLDGYWQTEKYFSDIAPILCKELTSKFTLSERFFLSKTATSVSVSISVHIRRGDYLKPSKANRYFTNCEMKYYAKAIDYLAQRIENPTFFVFSDDVEWAKTNFQFPFPIQFIEGHSAQEDLLLMASCQHHIIANSTFSWWGAWLNPSPDKIVIAPQKWFSTERFNTEDLLPESWIRL